PRRGDRDVAGAGHSMRRTRLSLGSRSFLSRSDNTRPPRSQPCAASGRSLFFARRLAHTGAAQLVDLQSPEGEIAGDDAAEQEQEARDADHPDGEVHWLFLVELLRTLDEARTLLLLFLLRGLRHLRLLLLVVHWAPDGLGTLTGLRVVLVGTDMGLVVVAHGSHLSSGSFVVSSWSRYGLLKVHMGSGAGGGRCRPCGRWARRRVITAITAPS